MWLSSSAYTRARAHTHTHWETQAAAQLRERDGAQRSRETSCGTCHTYNM